MKQSTDLAAEVFAILRCEFFDANFGQRSTRWRTKESRPWDVRRRLHEVKKFNCFRHFQHFIQHFSEIRTFLIHYIGLAFSNRAFPCVIFL